MNQSIIFTINFFPLYLNLLCLYIFYSINTATISLLIYLPTFLYINPSICRNRVAEVMKPYRSSADAYDMLMSRVAHKKNIQAAIEEEEEMERKKVCYALLYFAIHVHHLIYIAWFNN